MVLPIFIVEHLPFFRSIVTLKSEGQKKVALRQCTERELLAIIAVLYNLYIGNFSISKYRRNILKCHQENLAKILAKQITLDKKRSLIVNNCNCVIHAIRALLDLE